MSLYENNHTSSTSTISVSDDEENIVKIENKDSTDSDGMCKKSFCVFVCQQANLLSRLTIGI